MTLAWTLTENVYGQQIANEIIVSALKGHLRQSSPRSKALTLSFHGRPGVGKNYVATFIQNSLFDKGYKSRYAHFFSGRLHFPLESEVDIYKLNLIRWIQGNVSQCEYSVFVFDEVDKIPPKVLDAVKPFIDYHEDIYGVDFRKSIFIFLSNTGGDAIAEKYMQLWESGKKREELKLRDFEDMIRIGAFNERGGFYKSETIESSLIDHYIPFLPLEERHVRLCIHNEFNKRGYHPKENEVNNMVRVKQTLPRCYKPLDLRFSLQQQQHQQQEEEEEMLPTPPPMQSFPQVQTLLDLSCGSLQQRQQQQHYQEEEMSLDLSCNGSPRQQKLQTTPALRSRVQPQQQPHQQQQWEEEKEEMLPTPPQMQSFPQVQTLLGLSCGRLQQRQQHYQEAEMLLDLSCNDSLRQQELRTTPPLRSIQLQQQQQHQEKEEEEMDCSLQQEEEEEELHNSSIVKWIEEVVILIRRGTVEKIFSSLRKKKTYMMKKIVMMMIMMKRHSSER
ncbi:uncharacterized protein [Anabrus simplex]|uniref:uncharacterized protein isoform X2 n=1 Tax=Anabrus simplex TaxID=316456 RepID=UPI0035A2DBB1